MAVHIEVKLYQIGGETCPLTPLAIIKGFPCSYMISTRTLPLYRVEYVFPVSAPTNTLRE